MPSRRFDSARWGQAWWENLTGPEKLIYWYLESNDRCPACGIYTVTFKRIAQETDHPLPLVERAIMSMQPHIMYDRSFDMVFIRRFIKDQRAGKNWMISVERELNKLEPHPFIKEFLQENHIFKIGYKKPLDRVWEHTDTDTYTFPDSLSLDLGGDARGGSAGGSNIEGPPAPPKIAEPQAPVKNKIHDHVFMADSEYNNLCERFGRARVDHEIENLDSYLANNEKKREGKNAYTDHGKVISTWLRKEDQKKGGAKDGKGKQLAKGEIDWDRVRRGQG